MKKNLLLVALLFLLANNMFAQEELQEEIKSGDYYAAMFNENLSGGLRTSKMMSVKLPLYAYGEEVTVMQDDETEEVSGYMYKGYTIINAVKVGKAIRVLKEGIARYPDRLDLYFDLATCHLHCLESEKMMNVLEEAMEQEKRNNRNWLWAYDEVLPDTADMLFNRIQDDYNRFVEAEQLEYAEHLALTATLYFPERAEYWNDIAGIYILREDYLEAMKYLRKAYRQNPKDELIISNIRYVEQML